MAWGKEQGLVSVELGACGGGMAHWRWELDKVSVELRVEGLWVTLREVVGGSVNCVEQLKMMKRMVIA
ncbi:hypothetical protein V6N11_084448 [Hibiscus sabdariffa]|uniref:Uncharacterized protein n=2 Tax=Hibiscus sabdariffa TaxID=183260 RepID=A0ABR2A8R4_9ROSI